MSERKREIVFPGVWWKPEAEERKITGTAKFGYTQGIEVDLIGAFTGSIGIESLRSRTTYWGVGVNGKPFTLFSAYQKSISTHIPGLSTSTLEALQGVVGGHYQRPKDVLVHTVDVDFDYLTEWCGISGIAQEYNFTTKTQNWSASPPAAIILAHHGEFTITIVPHITTKHDAATVSLGTRCIFRIEAEKPLPWPVFQPILYAFQRFLSLAVGEPARPKRVQAKTSDQISELDGKPIWREIDIIITHSTEEMSREIHGHRMLFTLADVRKVTPPVFEQFLKCEDILEPVFDLFFPTYFFKLPPPQELLNMAHAIEAFHRVTIGGQYQADDTYAAGLKLLLLAAIPPSIDKDFRSSLERKMDFLHQFSLKRRLKDILRRFDNLVSPYVGNRDTFIQAATEARNRLVHASKENPAPEYSELWRFAQQLGLVLEIAILSEVGFSEDVIQQILSRSKRASLILNNLRSE